MTPENKDETPRRGRGRPPWEPTDAARERVRMLSAMGLRQRDIATIEGVVVDTLAKHCQDELSEGKVQGLRTGLSNLFTFMNGYRTVKLPGEAPRRVLVDERQVLQATLKHLSLVHGLHESALVDASDNDPLPWSDD